MTLRRTLLLAFIMLGLLPSSALSWLSFSRTREAMTNQIAQSLDAQARSLQTDIDAMMFERLENALVWSRSELMQDLRLGDVDKRVANYLVGLQVGYGGVYPRLDCLDADDVVVASSDAQRIGRAARRLDPAQLSFEASLAGGTARLFLPEPALPGRVGDIAIETAVAQAYRRAGDRPMRMRLDVDPAQIERLLDTAAIGHRVILVVDRQGRWVAASAGLRGRAGAVDAAVRRSTLAVAESHDTRVAAEPAWLAAAALIGRSPSRPTSSFAGSGWTTLVLQPVDEALRPVGQMAAIFAGLLLAVLLATFAAATLISSAIARPIADLIAVTRAYRKQGRLPTPQPAASRVAELDVLRKAYVEMILAVEHSRVELVRNSKMAMLGELAAVLAHEVRTPLGILRSSAQVLMRDKGLGVEGRELMGFIESETQRLNSLVSTMLDTARPRLPVFAPCDVHALLARCAQMHDLQRGLPESGHAILLDLAAHDAGIEADTEQLMQAMFNLLNNATQAAGPGGRIGLATCDDDGFLCITCADNGPGIAPGIAERIFDPFVSGRDGGIGLGLAVTRQIVGAHGGTIAVSRSAWGGAAFTLKLPRRRGNLPAN